MARISLLTLGMMNIDDYRANSQNFHELTKLIFFVESGFYGLFITLGLRVLWFNEQLCLSQMMHNFKIGGI